MHPYAPLPESAAGGSKTGRALCFSLACVALAMCLGAGLWQLALNNARGNGGRFTARQFTADLRTLAAAMRYLVEPDGGTTPPAVLASNFAGALSLQAPSLPVATLVCSSNQMEMPEPFTNRPARS